MTCQAWTSHPTSLSTSSLQNGCHSYYIRDIWTTADRIIVGMVGRDVVRAEGLSIAVRRHIACGSRIWPGTSPGICESEISPITIFFSIFELILSKISPFTFWGTHSACKLFVRTFFVLYQSSIVNTRSEKKVLSIEEYYTYIPATAKVIHDG